ncbi:hypothetical protein [Paenibacillus sp. FSL H8-0079]|uniref:hypothetical protein n=1 Tax=Paenibacillus sp. FSL H8-0079 TaxID=2921375 RepID=UPI0030EDD15D
MLRVILIDNPHDSRTGVLKDQLWQLGLTDETHVIPFDEAAKVLPIQSAPCVFLVGTEDLFDTVTGETVKDYVDFLRNKHKTEANISYLGELAIKARKVGIR